MTTLTITRAKTTDAEAIAGVIARAFHSLAVSEWLVPDPTERAEVLPAVMLILVEHALTYGRIEVTEDRSAAAVWMTRGTIPTPEPYDYDARLDAACGRNTARFHTLDRVFRQHHPTEPHCHLALLAVEPGRQGSGAGSALLANRHRILDEFRLNGYLEASSERARGLYLRHGYRDLGSPMRVTDGTPIWSMWRTPQLKTPDTAA